MVVVILEVVVVGATVVTVVGELVVIGILPSSGQDVVLFDGQKDGTWHTAGVTESGYDAEDRTTNVT